MRLRWYQSRLFWLGLVALIFQLTVWIHFLRTDAYVGWSPNSRSQYSLGWGNGSVAVSGNHWIGFMGVSGGYGGGFEYDAEPMDPEWEVDFFPPAFVNVHFGPPDFPSQEGWTYGMGYWVIVLIGGSLWITVMIWNQRRKKRWQDTMSGDQPVD